MAVQTLSYLDLTPEQRRRGANAARERIRGLLVNPFLTSDQKTHLQGELHRLDLWEKCLGPNVPPRAG
jgi:hypothetical protein